MSWVGRILLIANVAVAVVTACLVLGIYVAPDAASSELATEAHGVFRLAVRGNTTFSVATLLAALLVVADFLWVVYGSAPAGPPAHVVSEGPGGPLRIARDALEGGLRAAGENLGQISRVRVTVDATPGLKRIFVRAQFHAPENAPIHETSGQLRIALERRFRELVRLGEGMRLEIGIEFLGFAGKPLRKPHGDEPEASEQPSTASGAESGDEDEPFTGPRYPID